jgi:alpha-ketoglutarate-dependent taurine dioxygenase
METTARKKMIPVGRRAVSSASADLVAIGGLNDGPLPLLVQPQVADVSLRAWLGEQRAALEERLAAHGAVLFRGFPVRSRGEFEEIAAAGSGDLMDYSFRSTPRSAVGGRVYTSTEYPADRTIPMHNEMSYTSSWPMRVWFYCEQPSETGGETPLADSRRVYARLDPRLRQRFAERGVLYVRNYGEGVDLPWEEVFQTTDRAAVESFCHASGIELEWKPGNRLRSRQRRPAVARHPRTGEMVWFNQAHLFHRSSLPPADLAALLALVGEEDLPRDTFYGDGTAIEPDALAEIRGVFDEESVAFSWQQGDMVLVENMLTAHGRRPFTGARKVLVAMAQPMMGEPS